MLDIIIALLLGILVGTITGLSPGIHINLIAVIVVSSIGLFPQTPSIVLAIFIVSMSITHTFLDFIPSIFLGAPEEDSFLSILPGHRMLQEGKAYEAYVLTVYGSLTALSIIIILTPIYIAFLPSIFAIAKSAIPFILIFISLYLIFREDNFTASLTIFILAGFLGFLTFNLPVKEPLVPLLSGLFGISSLIISLKIKSKIPQQEIPPLRKIKLTKKEFFKSIGAILISSPFCAFLPGIGSGHAATIGSEIIPQNNRGFLFLVGATNTIIMGLSFVTLYAINKTRSGSAAATLEILKTITLQDLITILIAITIVGIIASALGIIISKICAKYISKINYALLTILTIATITLVNIFFSNILGIFILVISSSLGIFAISSNSRRINLMGALIIPAIIYYIM
ncbi:MAG TPA: tripartite tricarboxylate transporter permease [Candidatus Nanoarchaeia archaeon]|nr:tripartite tricarboxylate transporter permease [Candidatus Nanoarchaeia archaeon]